MDLIRATDLSFGNTKPIVQGLDLALRPGEIICVLGPNGAGKSTLFRTLLGLIPALAGEVRLSGTPIGQLRRAEIAKRLAHVPQAVSFPFPITVREAVLQGRAAHLGLFAPPGAEDRQRAEAALAETGILHLAMRAVTQLSGGERQLVAIARALAQQAPAVILDEPAASLDYGNRERLLVQLQALADRGLALLLATHEPDHARRIATSVLTIKRNGQARIGKPDELLSQAAIAELYDLSMASLSPI